MSQMEKSARDALELITTTMANDGYALTVSEAAEGTLEVRIEALEDACEECLVPKTVMEPMIESLLAEGGVTPSRLTVAYPAEITKS